MSLTRKYSFIFMMKLLILLSAITFKVQANTSIKNTPIIVIGEDIFPPYEFIDQEGKPSGFFIDIIEEVFQRMHQEYILRFDDWKTNLKTIDQNKADIMLNICYTNERAKKYAFTSTICYRYDAIVCKKESSIRSIQDLKDKKIFVIEKDISHIELINRDITSNIIPLSDTNLGVKFISKGKADAFIIPRYSAEESIRMLKIKDLEVRNTTQPPRKMCIAGLLKNTALINKIDRYLTEIKIDGTYQTIYDKWFGVHQDSGKISQKTQTFIILLILLSVLFLLFIIILKQQVNKATALTQLLNKRLLLSLKVGDTTVWHYNASTKAFTSIYGKPLPKFNITSKVLESYMFPEDLKKHHQDIQNVLDGKIDSANSTLCFHNPDNEKEIIYIKNEIIAEYRKGKAIGIIGSWRNITDDIRLKEELHERNQITLLSLQYGNVVTWEYDCKTRDFAILHQDKSQKHYYKTIKDYIKNAHPDSLPTVKRLYRIVTERVDQRFAEEIQYKLPNEEKWIYGTLVGIPFRKKGDSKITKYIGCSIDHTTLSETLFALKKAKEKAEKSDRLKSAFLANVSHEIRTPLNAIVGFSDLIVSSPNHVEKSEYINVINENNQLLLRLIEDILDLSRIESDCLEFKNEEVNLMEIMQELKTLYQTKTPQNIQFKIDLADTNYTLYIDKARLLQILSNFINNALKFTSEGYVAIGYYLKDKKIRIYCKDTGIGIQPKNLCLIFERFEKISPFTQGTGLGLNICKAIAKNYNGKIGVESIPQEGSTFWVEFPFQHIQKID